MNKSLFKPKRVCVSCQAEAPGARKSLSLDVPNLLSISFTMYALTPNGKAQVAMPKIQICDTCLCKAVVPARLIESKEALRLLAAIKERLSKGYNSVLDAGGE